MTCACACACLPVRVCGLSKAMYCHLHWALFLSLSPTDCVFLLLCYFSTSGATAYTGPLGTPAERHTIGAQAGG